MESLTPLIVVLLTVFSHASSLFFVAPIILKVPRQLPSQLPNNESGEAGMENGEKKELWEILLFYFRGFSWEPAL